MNKVGGDKLTISAHKRFLLLWGLLGLCLGVAAVFILGSGAFGAVLGLAVGMVGTVLVFLFYIDKNPEEKGENPVAYPDEDLDNRQIMLKDKAGRYAYTLGMVVLLAVTTGFFVMKTMGLVLSLSFVVSVYTALVVFLYVLGMVIYTYLDRRP